MKSITNRLEEIINDYSDKLKTANKDDWDHKPQPGKWSKKEILGHLIDSAQNNIRRFIVAQYEELPFIVYEQDKWVAISNYQHYEINDLVTLWTLLNKHICVILNNTSTGASERKCLINNAQPHAINWLAEDYLKHLLHHLHQVLLMEAIDYP